MKAVILAGGFGTRISEETMGYNLEPSEMEAAYGLVQLDKLDDNITIRIHRFN